MRISIMTLALTAMLGSACNEVDNGPVGNYTFDLHVYKHDVAMRGERGVPLPEVLVAVDTLAGRDYLLTNYDGHVVVTVPADTKDITLTATKAGWLPAVTIYRATIAEIETQLQAGQLYFVMEPPPAVPPSDTVQLTLVSHGTMSFCASVAPLDWCTRNGVQTPRVPRSQFPLTIVAYSTDAAGCPIELKQIMIPDTLTDRTVVLPFDGSGRRDVQSVDFSVRLPEASDSLMRTQGMYTGGRFPLIAWDSNGTRIWGGACNERFPNANTIEMTAAWFEPAHDSCLFDIAIFPNYNRAHNGDDMEYSWTALGGQPEPGAVYDVMDIPRIVMPTSDATLKSAFIARPLALEGMYQLLVIDARQRNKLLWDIRSFHQQNIVPPELPTGYTANPEWPADGQLVFRIQACNQVLPFTNVWPAPRGMACAVSAPLPGRL